ncbi:MAG: hypothetical protein M1833_006802 [Piccolia ochrophora]|nr:MAG: hypothetical protein M1833_006802 [Piccolia ochrophora]
MASSSSRDAYALDPDDLLIDPQEDPSQFDFDHTHPANSTTSPALLESPSSSPQFAVPSSNLVHSENHLRSWLGQSIDHLRSPSPSSHPYAEKGFMDSDDEGSRSATSRSYQSQRVPLIDLIKNEWKTNPRYGQLNPATWDDEGPNWLKIIRAPRFRRYGIAYLLLLLTCVLSWKWWLRPHLEIQTSMAKAFDERMHQKQGWYGVNIRPAFTDMIHLQNLDERLKPTVPKSGGGSTRTGKRLIVVGDVHGCKKELTAILEKVAFKKERDHLILAGDMIAKGPDSAGVLDLALEKGASCVRGNHEDRMILSHTDATSKQVVLPGPGEDPDSTHDDLEEESFSHGDYRDRALADTLTPKHIDFLKSCPVILNVGYLEGMGDVVVVHGGLVPGVELDRQDSFNVMNMRTIDVATHVPSEDSKGVPWAKLWNHYQTRVSKSSNRSTVIYGHDAKRGRDIQPYSKGLDSGCVRGGKLTALIISGGRHDKVAQTLVDVECEGHLKKGEM